MIEMNEKNAMRLEKYRLFGNIKGVDSRVKSPNKDRSNEWTLYGRANFLYKA